MPSGEAEPGYKVEEDHLVQRTRRSLLALQVRGVPQPARCVQDTGG